MGFLEKGSSYPDLKNNTSAAKTDRDKLKLFAEQLKSVFATKMKLKDQNLKRELVIFLSLTFNITLYLNLLMIMKNSLVLMNWIESSKI